MLCFSIYSAGHAFSQLYRPLLADLGLAYPQFLVLVSLWSRDGRTVKELGEALFLTRTRNRQDGRQVLLNLTAEGQALKDRTAPVRSASARLWGLMPRRRERSRSQSELSATQSTRGRRMSQIAWNDAEVKKLKSSETAQSR